MTNFVPVFKLHLLRLIIVSPFFSVAQRASSMRPVPFCAVQMAYVLPAAQVNRYQVS